MTVGRVARWILLLCTMFGLALMHTLGHADMRMGADAGAPHLVQPGAAMIEAGGIAVMGPTAAGSRECSGGHCDGHGDGGMSGWSVCLAVLTALAVIVLLGALLSRASSGRRWTLWEPVRVAAPRAPPRRAAGLRLASVAVLRI